MPEGETAHRVSAAVELGAIPRLSSRKTVKELEQRPHVRHLISFPTKQPIQTSTLVRTFLVHQIVSTVWYNRRRFKAKKLIRCGEKKSSPKGKGFTPGGGAIGGGPLGGGPLGGIPRGGPDGGPLGGGPLGGGPLGGGPRPAPPGPATTMAPPPGGIPGGGPLCVRPSDRDRNREKRRGTEKRKNIGANSSAATDRFVLF